MNKLALLLLLPIGAFGLVACAGGDDDEDSATGARPSPHLKIERTANAPFMEIERTANKWASLFAAGSRTCKLMTQPACERLNCERISGPIRNCTPPSSKFRKSFEDATVQDLIVPGDKAAARFSNGETVKLEYDGHDRVWRIHKWGRNVGDVEFITAVGNQWAPLFAEDTSVACKYMYGQPLCEEFFGRIGAREVGRPSKFQRSFANATVERVQVKRAQQIKTADGTLIDEHKAVAEFSNGELVEFIQDPHGPPSSLANWFIDDVGGNAGDADTGTPPSRRGVEIGIDVQAGVHFSLEGRQLTVSLFSWTPNETHNRVVGARIRATCGETFTTTRDVWPTRTRRWPAGRDTLRFRFARDISKVARWCRVEDPAVGHVAFVKFGSAPARPLSATEKIERTANAWARLFAASDPAACARYMGQPACDRMWCMRNATGPIDNCTPPSRAFRRSFRGARVEEVAIQDRRFGEGSQDRRAGVRFSNGRTVLIIGMEEGPEQGGVWWIERFQGNPSRRLFER